jgi:Zn-dependent peptidase ImmA (M78 family)
MGNERDMNDGSKARPRSKKDIRREVENLKRKLNISINDKTDVAKVLDDMTDLGYEYEIVVDGELDDAVYAITEINRMSIETIKIKESVYLRAVEGSARDRFTIIHEVGHAVMHSERIYHRRGDEIKVYEQPEWQANQFAAEFLMPTKGIIGIDADGIKKKYNVSKSAALIRAKVPT